MAHLSVRRGSGTFELAMMMVHDGSPHVYFVGVDHHSAGGVYFGKGASLWK